MTFPQLAQSGPVALAQQTCGQAAAQSSPLAQFVDAQAGRLGTDGFAKMAQEEGFLGLALSLRPDFLEVLLGQSLRGGSQLQGLPIVQSQRNHLLRSQRSLGQKVQQKGITHTQRGAAVRRIQQLLQLLPAQQLARGLERPGEQEPLGPLLVGRDHHRLPAREVQRMMQKYRQWAHLVPITLHSLRHLFGSRVLEVGGHVRQLQQLLGHRRLNTVEVYTHSAPDELAKVLARLPISN